MEIHPLTLPRQMTAQQIIKRVAQEADARFDEVIECLLILLQHEEEESDRTSDLGKLVAKWKLCGLLAKVTEENIGEAARALERTAFILINEASKKGDTSWEINEENVVIRFREAVAPYNNDSPRHKE